MLLLFQTLSILKPKGIKVVGGLSLVRNSIGAGRTKKKICVVQFTRSTLNF